jgi:hypothetical protein
MKRSSPSPLQRPRRLDRHELSAARGGAAPPVPPEPTPIGGSASGGGDTVILNTYSKVLISTSSYPGPLQNP